MTSKHVVHFDQGDQFEYRGWAWSASDASSSPTFDLMVTCGGVSLGRKRRTIKRPDVDAHVNDHSGPKGFALPIVPLYSLGPMLGNPQRYAPVVQFGDKALSATELPARFRDISTFRSLVLADDAGPLKVTDLWFASSRQLRLRLEATSKTKSIGAITIRFYQPRLSGEGAALELVHEQIEDRLGSTTATIPLSNPFLPLLLVAEGSEEEILAADLLPYPSLCRGGAHAAELSAWGLGGSGLSGLRLLSDSLVREFVGWSGSPPPRSIGRIVVDGSAAGGPEPIGASMSAWLSAVFGISPERSAAEHPPEPPEAVPKQNQVLTLTIPHNAVPTISAIVSRRLGDGIGRDAEPMPFCVSEADSSQPKWLVRLPSTADWFERLQPAASTSIYPVLSNPGAERKAAARPAAVPAAILFHDPPRQPVDPMSAQDHRQVALRKDGRNGAPNEQTASIVVAVRGRSNHRLAGLLESVARQTMAGRCEAIVVRAGGRAHDGDWLRELLERTFPRAHQLIEHDGTFNRNLLINLGASKAGGHFVLVADSSVVLDDPQTLDILSQLASEPRVATAGCMILHRPTASAQVAFHGAGYFPGSIEFGAIPHVSLMEPDCGDGFPLATYPVAANSFDLSMIRSDVWSESGGLNERSPSPSHSDVEFALRASQRDLMHLCTTAVSAYCDRRRTRGALTDIPADGLARTAVLADLLGKAAVFRKL